MGTYRTGKIDLPLVFCYLFLVLVGWLNIFSAVYSEEHRSIFDFSQRYGMQFVWIVTAIIIAAFILFVFNSKAYSVLSPFFYAVTCLLLIAVIFVGEDVHGSNSWFRLGPVSFQPAELSKTTTSLFLAYVMSKYNFRLGNLRDAAKVAFIILFPMLVIIMEKETGSALVYCGFIFLLYVEGLSGWVLLFGFLSILLFVVTLAASPLAAIIVLFALTGLANGAFTGRMLYHLAFLIPMTVLLAFLPALYRIEALSFLNAVKVEYLGLGITSLIVLGITIHYWKKRARHIKFLFTSFVCAMMLIFSVEFIFNNILQPHQRSRIENLLGIEEDLMGAGYNVHQSKIAIGSGGFAGKGFLHGTQTKFDFVPEQSTDFIFCTIGEEWGFLGSVTIVGVYLFLIGRLILLSERQKDRFAKIYGYCVASIFFMHVFINIGMTMGLVPVIGIPLPFLSYGGSSLWSFTVLLFIFIRLDMDRWR